MGLDNLVNEKGGTGSGNRFRAYPYHEFEDQCWEWFNEFQERFPIEIEADFIEISDQITKVNARAYWRIRDNEYYQFIRLSEKFINNAQTWRIKQCILHEMVHLYFYQLGYRNDDKKVTDGSTIFKWVCGAVGAKVNQIPVYTQEWQKCAEPFIDDSLCPE